MSGGYEFRGLQYSSEDGLPNLLFWLYQRNTFFFDAERYSIGKCQHGHAERLASNASNLPAVLQTLSGERGSIFDRLIGHMREIFSSFGNLSVRPDPQTASQNEILVWPTKEMTRSELGFSLDASGTGLAQVLALLTAVMTLENCVIIVDEISSFLHPAATKALLRIVNAYYSHNQYIISTHAPEVISFSENKTVYIVKMTGYMSCVTTIDLSKKDNFRDVAELLGISMTDVFASNQMIWVEGPTEELCFPYIYQKMIGAVPHGLLFSTATPGDFNAKRRDKEMVYEIYSKLSQASASLTISLAFSFDSEKLTLVEKEKMISDSRGLIHFLPRRHLECYIINSEAIASFINHHDKEQVGLVSANEITKELMKLAAEDRFNERVWRNDLTDVNWLILVDAAKIIKACCENLTSARVTFCKKNHTLFIIRHILENDAKQLEELIKYVKMLVDTRSLLGQ